MYDLDTLFRNAHFYGPHEHEVPCNCRCCMEGHARVANAGGIPGNPGGIDFGDIAESALRALDAHYQELQRAYSEENEKHSALRREIEKKVAESEVYKEVQQKLESLRLAFENAGLLEDEHNSFDGTVSVVLNELPDAIKVRLWTSDASQNFDVPIEGELAEAVERYRLQRKKCKEGNAAVRKASEMLCALDERIRTQCNRWSNAAPTKELEDFIGVIVADAFRDQISDTIRRMNDLGGKAE